MKEFVAWLGILGIPSIFSMCVWSIRSCLHYTKQLKILIKAQQAQMRSQLIEQYHQYIDQGYMTDEMLTPDYIHWLYTAFTRASEQLFLVNWSKQQTEER